MSPFTLMFNGDAYQGPPIADIAVDGVATPSVPITAAVGSPAQAVTLQLSPGPHAVSVSFNNDAYGGPGKDRNLYLLGATLDGQDSKLPAHTFGRNSTLTFIVVARDAAPAAPDIPALLTTMQAELDTQLGVILASVKAIAAAPPPGPPAPPPGLNLGSLVLVDGGTTLLQEGSYAGVLHVPVTQRIVGHGMRRTIQDNSAGIRLAWGKGGLHIMAPGCVIEDMGFMHDGSGASDGEAGIYFENFAGPATVRRCAFDANENGIFMPDAATSLIDLLLDQCVFGRIAANGESDGRSHNTYLGGRSVKVTGGIYFPSEGNDFKLRGPALDMADAMFIRTAGRFIDCPGGTDVVTARMMFVTPPGATGQNDFGFFDEGDTNAAPGAGSWTSTDDSFYLSRFQEVLWINNPNTKVQLIRPKVFWIGSPGSQPPSVTIMGPGTLACDNPFVFTEANRVDQAPPVPADPTA